MEQIVFSPKLVKKAGPIEKVLEGFLDGQAQKIQAKLSEQNHSVDENAVIKLLNQFASLEGTKLPLPKDAIKEHSLNKESLFFCLDQLEKARILRLDDGIYELTHDVLANHITTKRSGEETALLELVKLIQDRRFAYERTKILLSRKELEVQREEED